MASGRILVVDDEPAMLENCDRLLTSAGYECMTLEQPATFRDVIATWRPDALLLDVRMPDVDGSVLLTVALADDPGLPVIMMTAFASVPAAVESIREGAFDYLAKPFKAGQLVLAVERAMRHRALVRENRELREQVRARRDLPTMIGSCPAMESLRGQIQKAATARANVLILGESGTGKEVVARRVHGEGDRRAEPFVAVDCAALPQSLLESELFGHERGAFTGAEHQKVGLVERASGGTLFLDEVTELTTEMQAKLLRALEQRQIRRLGGSEVIDVDIRILAATNIDLRQAVSEGAFREDLYFRLDVIPIHVPPLRDRGDDLFLLAAAFLTQASEALGKETPTVSPLVWHALERHRWPGNVRELKNLMERLVILEDGGRITLANLPEPLRPAGTVDRPPGADLPLYEEARDEALRTFREAYLGELLSYTQGNVSRAARHAGVSRRTIHRWLADGEDNEESYG